jgi:hypothetical protein
VFSVEIQYSTPTAFLRFHSKADNENRRCLEQKYRRHITMGLSTKNDNEGTADVVDGKTTTSLLCALPTKRTRKQQWKYRHHFIMYFTNKDDNEDFADILNGNTNTTLLCVSTTKRI